MAQVRDRAGNVGSSYPLGARGRGAPRGGGGMTVRYVAGQAPTRAVPGGSRATVFVDAARGRLPLAPAPARRSARRSCAGARVARCCACGCRAARSGVYLLELRSGTHRAKVPLVVNGPGRQKVLVVLPLVTWQGRNQADDDGDGLPNTLESGGPVRIARPFAGSGEPPGFARHESPLLRLLDRPRQRYDLETDYRLARRKQSYLDRYGGIVIASDARWVEPRLAARLRRYVAQGGRVFSLGTRSLRREVQARRGLLVRPSGESASTSSGRGSIRSLAAEGRSARRGRRDRAVRGRDGSFSEFEGYEVTRSPGEDARSSRPPRRRRAARSSSPCAPGRASSSARACRTFDAAGGQPNVSTLIRRVWEVFSQ